MRGWLLRACLAIGITTILSNVAIRAENDPLFGPPPLLAERSGSSSEKETGTSQPGVLVGKEVPRLGGSPLIERAAGPVSPTALSKPPATAESFQAVPDAASRELPAAAKADRPAPLVASRKRPVSIKRSRPTTTVPVRPLPKPSAPGYMLVEDTGWRSASKPVDDPGYAHAGRSEPRVAEEEGSPGSTCSTVFVCDDQECSSCNGTIREYQEMCASGACRQCTPWTVPQPCELEQLGIKFGGWIDQGITVAANRPADRYNGLVTFNDRDAEYQANQTWLYLERKLDESACCWDVGGRIDFLYGTDARFIQARDGLESDWGQTESFYQIALPQAYIDVAYRGWTVRAGRFLTLLGYESPMAPNNFFYSHSYAMQYGEPFTHLGLLGMRQVGRVSLAAGLQRGNDQFNDTDGRDALNFIGGLSMTSRDEKMTGAFAFTATEEGPNVTSYIHSLVATMQLTNRLAYIIQGDYGETWYELSRTKEAWTGINQYLLYTINDCWAAGVRSEWFRDRDGSRIAGQGVGNQNTGPYSGDFYEITLGLNWSPHANLTVRPEARWDIFDPIGQPGNLGAFDAGDRNTQFVFGCDLICTF